MHFDLQEKETISKSGGKVQQQAAAEKKHMICPHARLVEVLS